MVPLKGPISSVLRSRRPAAIAGNLRPPRAALRRRPTRPTVAAAAASATGAPASFVRELELAVAALPGLEGVLPGGDEKAKQRVLAAVAALEAAAPFRPEAPGAAAALLGAWALVFASDGTVVTRTGAARALAALSPAGLGLRDIQQRLEGDAGAPAAGAGVACSNSVTLGLGLLGTWQLRVSGRWLTTHRPSWRQSSGGGSTSTSSTSNSSSSTGSSSSSALDSEVMFDALGVKLVGLPGFNDLKLPELKLTVPGGPRAPRAEPNWRTTYVDNGWRIGLDDGYVARMRRDGTWGGHVELQALALALRRDVLVYQAGQPRWAVRNQNGGGSGCGDGAAIHLAHEDGEHYNSVRLADDYSTGLARPILLADGGATATQHARERAAWTPADEARVAESTACDNLALVRRALAEAACLCSARRRLEVESYRCYKEDSSALSSFVV